MTQEPTKVQIFEQLERILRSDHFVTSPQKRKFLRHIVEKTLEGQAASLKGYAIGVDVFDRGDNFDPQLDSIVRSQARNLRQALDLYYLTTGASDPVRIDVPKGKYVPVFSFIKPGVIEPGISANADALSEISEQTRTRQPRAYPAPAKFHLKAIIGLVVMLIAVFGFAVYAMTSRVATNTFDDASLLPQGPSLTVLPFEILGKAPTDPLNDELINLRIGLHHEIVSNLSRFKTLFVKGLSDIGDGKLINSARAQNTQYFLSGTIQRLGDEIRIYSVLKRASTGEIIWTHAYDEQITGAETFLKIQTDIAVQVAGALGQTNSSIHRKFTTEHSKLSDMQLEHYFCLMRFYSYMNGKTVDEHRMVRECLETATREMPKFSTAWAALAQMYADEDFNRYNPRQLKLSPAERAREAALKAVAADSENAMAYQYLAMSNFLVNDELGFREAAQMTLKLNPNYADGLAMVGMYLIRLDNSEQGKALVEKAIAMNPASPSWYHGAITLYYYIRHDTETALYHARRFHQNGSLPAHTLYVVTLVQNGQIEQAKEVYKALVERYPFFPKQYPNIFTRRRLPEGALEQMVSDLVIAGLVPLVPDQ